MICIESLAQVKNNCAVIRLPSISYSLFHINILPLVSTVRCKSCPPLCLWPHVLRVLVDSLPIHLKPWHVPRILSLFCFSFHASYTCNLRPSPCIVLVGVSCLLCSFARFAKCPHLWALIHLCLRLSFISFIFMLFDLFCHFGAFCETLTSHAECCWAHCLWRWCVLWCVACELPNTGVLWVLTGTHPCDAPFQAG